MRKVQSDHVVISHPEKVLFPDDGISKGELAAYYEAVAPVMLPHLARRPVTMERFHRGIGERGFFQKDVKKGFPAWLERVEVPKKGGTVHYPIVTDARGIAWLANQNCITPHVWAARVPELYYPDVCVFDLDPATDDARAVRIAAIALRDLLNAFGLPSWVKTSGSKGFHIVVPLDGKANSGEVSHFANLVGTRLVERHPDALTQEFSKADRAGRLYVDTGRNGYGATFAAAYAVRAKTGAPVSAPCSWEEIESGAANPRSFTLRSVPERVSTLGDPWAELYDKPRSLRKALETLAADSRPSARGLEAAGNGR